MGGIRRVGGRLRASGALVAALACLGLPASASAAPVAPGQAVPGEIIVQFAAGADGTERADARVASGVVADKALGTPAMQLVHVDTPGASVGDAIATLEAQPGVVGAEPNGLLRLAATPNDPLFPTQLGLENIGQTVNAVTGTPDADVDATGAWNYSTGVGQTVGVLDTGVQPTHPDLLRNLVLPGLDFANTPADPVDHIGHGTHVAGIIAAARDNGTGVVGVSPDAKIVSMKASVGTQDALTVADAAQAINGASPLPPVVNGSFETTLVSTPLQTAIASHPGALFVVAAGNDGRDIDAGAPVFPCGYSLPNVICVAATTPSDDLASFSNWGATSVDLAAPGVDIASTFSDQAVPTPGLYAVQDGTSMSAPFVAGAAALYMQKNPGASVAQVKAALLGAVDVLPALQGKTVTGGRLNVAKLFDHTAPSAPALVQPVDGDPSLPGPIVFDWTDATDLPDPDGNASGVEWYRLVIDGQVIQDHIPASTTMWPPQLALGAHTWHVDAVDAAGNATSSATRTVVVVASLPAAAGPPAPAPAPAPAPVVDTTAPLGTLKLTSAQGLRTILAKGLAGSTTSNEAGPRTVEIVLDAKTAKKLHLGAKALVVGRATVASAPPGVRAFTVKLTARAKAKLRTLRSVNVTIRATLKDVTGNALVVVRAATIRR